MEKFFKKFEIPPCAIRRTVYHMQSALTPAATIEEDLLRRDFTVNALAYHPERGLIDPFGGIADLEAGQKAAAGLPIS